MHQKCIPEDWMQKKYWQPNKMENLYFLWQMVQQNFTGWDYELQEPTLRRESTVRREDISGESHGDREEFRPEDMKRWRRNQYGLLGSRRSSERNSLIVIILNREVQLAERRIINYFTRFIYWANTPPRRNIRCGRRSGEKPKHLMCKIKFNFFGIAGTGRNSVLSYNLTQEFVPTTRSQESSSPKFLWRWKQAHVVSSRSTAYLWDKILQVNTQSGEYGILSSENLGSNEYEFLMLVCPANFEESRVTYGSKDSGDLSLRDACLGKPRSAKDLAFQAIMITDEKATMEEEWKEVIKKAHKNKKIRKVPFAALTDIRHIQKYMDTPGKCSKEQYNFFTWEIILGLINLYISKVFHGSRMNEPIVTEKSHFIAKSLSERSWWTWNDTIGTNKKTARRIHNDHSATSAIIESSGLSPNEFW